MVGIVILDYNNAQDTINCIESVVKHTPQGLYKLMVVENGSKEETVRLVSEYVATRFAGQYTILHDGDTLQEYPFLSLLISRTNDGYAKGNNKALYLLDKDPDVDYVMILNNDILFVEDIITPMMEYNKQIPNCGIISATLLKGDGKSIDVNCARKDYKKTQFFFQYLFLFKDIFGILSFYEKKQRMLVSDPSLMEKDSFEIEMPSGSCMLIKKETFREMDYFDMNTFLYFEENILYRKTKQLGLKNYLIPSVKCIHLGAAAVEKKLTSSYFTNKCHMESNAYYLKAYRNAPLLSLYVRIMSKLTLLKIKILKH